MSEKQPISRTRKLIAGGALAVAGFGAGMVSAPEQNTPKPETTHSTEAKTMDIEYLNKSVSERINADEPVDFILARLDIGVVDGYSEKTPNGIYSITKSVENPLLIMDVPAGKDNYTDDLSKWYLGSASWNEESESYEVSFRQFDSETMRLELHSMLPSYPYQASVGSTKLMNNAGIGIDGFQMHEQVLVDGQHMVMKQTNPGLDQVATEGGPLQVAVEHPYFFETTK